ncbi:MAG: hypothetical protein KatS3mg056_2928 [Chloroflexus sp.]|nr:MAG: hypothetical protein KatS3mg056_2928 [Chloroflexus sp.]
MIRPNPIVADRVQHIPRVADQLIDTLLRQIGEQRADTRCRAGAGRWVDSRKRLAPQFLGVGNHRNRPSPAH